jgi:transposase
MVQNPTRRLPVRGADEQQITLIATKTPDQLVPQSHPIREIKAIVDTALGELNPAFKAMYSATGRPSIPPEQLLKASLLMALYSIRSERQFCERLRFDLLFKWFLHLNIDDEGFDHSTFSKNRGRLVEHEIGEQFLKRVVDHPRFRKHASQDHFSVDGSLLETWASIRSLKRIDGDDSDRKGPVKGEPLKNSTHRSTTDPEARLLRKTRHGPATLGFMAEALIENDTGLVVDFELVQATGTAERETALDLLGRRPGKRRSTVAADKLYDTKDFIREARKLKVTPHVAQIKNRRGGSAIDGRTTRHESYKTSQRNRKRVEEVFAWIKTIGGCRKLRFIGLAKNRLWVLFSVSAYNIIRISKLDGGAMPA